MRTDRVISIGQCKFGVRGIEPRRRPARTPRAEEDKRRIHGADGFRVCAVVQPRQLTANHRNPPRKSAQN